MDTVRTRKAMKQLVTFMTTKQHIAEEQSIVVADDDPLYLSMICELLANEGYSHVYGVPSAQVSDTIRNMQPALVLIDIHVASPQQHWLQLEQLLSNSTNDSFPVIICTTNPRLVLNRVEHLLNQGCEILEKPFDVDDLLIRIRGRVGKPNRPLSDGTPLF
jgi:DNA-binding response OmpR family regulator